MGENVAVGRYLYAIAVNSFAGLVDLTGSTWMRVVRQDDVWTKVGDDLRFAIEAFGDDADEDGLEPAADRATAKVDRLEQAT